MRTPWLPSEYAILNTAVPAIARAMDVTPLSVKSVLASYTLSLAVFIPVSGWMADRFGPRSILLLAGVSSLAAAGVAAVLLRHCRA